MKSLYVLASAQQNRGNESTGFGLYSDGIKIVKEMGRPDEVFKRVLEIGVNGDRGTSQTRYSTRGRSDIRHSQPFFINEGIGLVINHNGTIANADELRKKHPELKCKTRSDTEIAGRIISSEGDVLDGLERLYEEAIGSYNLVIMDECGDIYSYRDERGFHPLWWSLENDSFLVMSEDMAANALLRKSREEFKPAELLKVGENGIESYEIGSQDLAECFFEVNYFQLPGSTHRGKENMERRMDIGRVLGEEEKIDGIVVPVLDSGKYYAEGFAEASGLEYIEALHRNRDYRVYMDAYERSGDKYKLSREEKAALKHITIPSKIKGKKVILLDDSIVRGSTSRVITKNLRKLGAEEVHWRIGSPPIRYGCIYGLDHSVRKKLVAAPFEKDIEEEVARIIGADSVRYISIDDLKKCLDCRGDHCYACLTGEYPTEVPEEMRSAIEI
ncbi:MAG: hypothetical protein DRP11_00715 [Candidatus Aenigmatarchaeota archaeon]|nr:MAG: hypothetical protein DRP11_00715 [Candidatus Aenigmarchaeota archaeon]